MSDTTKTPSQSLTGTSHSQAEIEAAVNAGWRTPFLFIDSVWIEDQPSLQGLRNNPRFKALMAKVRQDLTRQRAAVQLR